MDHLAQCTHRLASFRLALPCLTSLVQPCPTLPYPTLHCLALPSPHLSSPALLYPTLYCPALPSPHLSSPALPYPALPCPDTSLIQPSPALPCATLPCPALPSPHHTTPHLTPPLLTSFHLPSPHLPTSLLPSPCCTLPRRISYNKYNVKFAYEPSGSSGLKVPMK